MRSVALAQMNGDVILVLGEIYLMYRCSHYKGPFNRPGALFLALGLCKPARHSGDWRSLCGGRVPPSLLLARSRDVSADNNYHSDALCKDKPFARLHSLSRPAWESETPRLDERNAPRAELTRQLGLRAPGSGECPRGAFFSRTSTLSVQRALLPASEMGNPSVELSLRYQYLAP